MTRILLQYLLPLLLPTLIYLAWVWLGDRRTAGGPTERLQQGPWFWLILAGVALMAVVLVTTALTSGVDPDARIVPPVYKDGRVIPWHVE